MKHCHTFSSGESFNGMRLLKAPLSEHVLLMSHTDEGALSRFCTSQTFFCHWPNIFSSDGKIWNQTHFDRE